MRKSKKQLSGGAKLAAAGKRAVLLGIPPDIYALIEKASKLEMRPVSQFVLYYACCASLEVLDNHDTLTIEEDAEKRLLESIARNGAADGRGRPHGK